MKNVAVIVPTLNCGGAERMAANMSVALQQTYNVYTIVFSSNDITYDYGGVLVDINVPPALNASVFKRISNVFKRVIALRKVKKKYKIDCAISHMDGANFVNIFSHLKEKVITVYHTMPRRSNLISKVYHNVISLFSFKYIVVSELGARRMKELNNIKGNRVEGLHNFCDVKEIKSKSESGLNNVEAEEFFKKHNRIVITVGRLSKAKAQHHLIKAFGEVKKTCPDTGLVILGEGEKRERLQSIIDSLNLQDDVYMPGNVSNPFAYVKKANVFVLSSHNEGLPMVLIEAMACGCPVISTDMPSGAREVLAPNTDVYKVAKEKEYAKFGMLVPVCHDSDDIFSLNKNEKILKDAIIEFLTDDNIVDKYRGSSSAGAESYNVDTIIKKWVELIEA